MIFGEKEKQFLTSVAGTARVWDIHLERMPGQVGFFVTSELGGNLVVAVERRGEYTFLFRGVDPGLAKAVMRDLAAYQATPDSNVHLESIAQLDDCFRVRGYSKCEPGDWLLSLYGPFEPYEVKVAFNDFYDERLDDYLDQKGNARIGLLRKGVRAESHPISGL